MDDALERAHARLVLFPDMEEEKLGGPIVRRLLHRAKNSRGPLALGRGPAHGEWQELGKRLSDRASYWYEVDSSSFDTYVPAEVIHDAFEIVRYAFEDPNDPKVIRYLDWCKDNLINSVIQMPDGYVFQKNRGVPSGSIWTSLIDSIANYIMLRQSIGTAIKDRGGCVVTESRHYQIIVGGDDSVIAYRGPKGKQVTIGAIVRVMSERYGSEIKDRKCVGHSVFTRTWLGVGGVKFYGRYWRDVDYLPMRDIEETHLQLASPDRRSSNRIEEILRIVASAIDNPFDANAKNLCVRYADWLLRQPWSRGIEGSVRTVLLTGTDTLEWLRGDGAARVYEKHPRYEETYLKPAEGMVKSYTGTGLRKVRVWGGMMSSFSEVMKMLTRKGGTTEDPVVPIQRDWETYCGIGDVNTPIPRRRLDRKPLTGFTRNGLLSREHQRMMDIVYQGNWFSDGILETSDLILDGIPAEPCPPRGRRVLDPITYGESLVEDVIRECHTQPSISGASRVRAREMVDRGEACEREKTRQAREGG
jgi:hypothetical protein